MLLDAVTTFWRPVTIFRRSRKDVSGHTLERFQDLKVFGRLLQTNSSQKAKLGIEAVHLSLGGSIQEGHYPGLARRLDRDIREVEAAMSEFFGWPTSALKKVVESFIMDQITVEGFGVNADSPHTWQPTKLTLQYHEDARSASFVEKKKDTSWRVYLGCRLW